MKGALGELSKTQMALLTKLDPTAFSILAELVNNTERREETEECERSLIRFFELAWPNFDPAPLKINWHHEVIAEHLEAVSRGEIRRLLINVPPRASKTGLVNICWPAWTWCQTVRGFLSGPQVRFMCISYGATLSLEIATTARRLVMGEWYQDRWGDRVQITEDQGSKEFLATKAGGFRIATSMKGASLGRGGDIRILDDPMSVDQANSDIERTDLNRIYDEALATRETDPANSAEVIIMQRLHEQDTSGHVLQHWEEHPEGVELVHLMLPMEFEPQRMCFTRWGCDRRGIDNRGNVISDNEGELLWPEHFTPDALDDMKRRLGPFAYAGQLQQRPVTRGGGIIKREWWRLWPDDYPEAGSVLPIYVCATCGWHMQLDETRPVIPCRQCGVDWNGDARSWAEKRVAFPEFSYRLLSVDTSYGEKKENSWSAATCWGIWHDKTDAPRAMLMTAWRGRPRLKGIADSKDPAEKIGLVERIYKIATERQVDTVLIEHKSRGQDLYQELERAMMEWPFQLAYFEPTRQGSKSVRLEACVPLFADERVWAPDKQWAETVISEVSSAPKAEFDDLADTCAQALLWMRRQGLISLPAEARREAMREKAQPRSTYRERGSIGELYEGI